MFIINAVAQVIKLSSQISLDVLSAYDLAQFIAFTNNMPGEGINLVEEQEAIADTTSDILTPTKPVGIVLPHWQAVIGKIEQTQHKAEFQQTAWKQSKENWTNWRNPSSQNILRPSSKQLPDTIVPPDHVPPNRAPDRPRSRQEWGDIVPLGEESRKKDKCGR